MNILFAYCRNPVAGILTPTAARQGRVVIHNYVLRGGAAGPQGSSSYLTGPTAPDPFPALGTGPVTPRVPEEGKLRANSRGLGPPIGVRDILAPVRTPHARRTSIPPGRGPGAPRVPHARWKTRPPAAFNADG